MVFWEEEGVGFTSCHFASFLALTAAVSKSLGPVFGTADAAHPHGRRNQHP